MTTRKKRDRAAMMAGIASATGKVQPLLPQSSTVQSRRPKSREGMVALTSWHPPQVVRQLKMLSAESGIRQQRLVARALNHLFREHGKPEIA
jgi:hypothetical protein